MIKTLRMMTALGGLLVVGTGCEELDGLDPYLPQVTFQELAVDDVDWTGVESRFVFNVHNPNPVGINLARFDYALAFEQVEWLAGDSPEGLSLEAEGDSELALPVAFEFTDLYDLVQALRGVDDVDFALNGSFGFDTDWGPIDIPYAEEGGFPAPRKPDIQYNALRLQELSFSGAELALKLDVDNEHGSNLLFRNMDYRMSLAGVDVGGGFLDELGEVDGASTRTLSVPIQVNFADVGLALYDVLTGDRLTVDLDASMDVDTPFGVIPLELNRSGQVDLQR
ncbi:MAG: LEA type 2 family protein [Alphaproteobacteria bacterium]|nr:LEA type 2 family protein [Alphaproteobacteria bacterium]